MDGNKKNRAEPQFTYYFCSHLIELIPTYACGVSRFKQIDLSSSFCLCYLGFDSKFLEIVLVLKEESNEFGRDFTLQTDSREIFKTCQGP